MSDKKHVHILSELYAHPVAHNIKWRELIPGLASIGIVHTDKNGSHHFTRNGHAVVMGHTDYDTLGTEEILKLRHFIHASALSQNKTPDLSRDVVIAVDHHKAIVFHNIGTAMESRSEERADRAKFRVLHKRPTSPPYSNIGPNIDDDYYAALLKELSNAERIVILGHGTSSSNAASQLMALILKNNPEIMHRVAAVQLCDLNAITEPQMINLGKRLLVNAPFVSNQ